MYTYYCSLAYDGSRFNGFQLQPNKTTVQGELNKTLSKLFKDNILINAVSRTDSGVHALDQRIWFSIEEKLPEKGLLLRVNKHLDYMQLNCCQLVLNSFHWSSIEHQKIYQYKLLFAKAQPYERPYLWPLDIDYSQNILAELRSIFALFTGYYDFELFSKHDRARQITDFKRKINYINLLEDNLDGRPLVKVEINGDGFLWMMVRFIVAYAIACLKGKVSKSDLELMLKKKKFNLGNRPVVKAAPASGLYLYKMLTKENQIISYDFNL